MKRLFRVAASSLLILGSVSAGASPAYAAGYYGCIADGKNMFGSYPVNHNQDVYTCEWSPYYRYWKYSHTCQPGTHAEVTLKQTSEPYLYIASTTCVND